MSVQPENVKGQTLLSSDGESVGTIDDVYIDPGTGEPEYLEVKTGGRFRSKTHFVPVEPADIVADGVQVPWNKDRIENAPSVQTEGELTAPEESSLQEYYRI
ncbi:MAG: PRC-barrel domain-containing protein [Sporichthyaceae bacterium]